MQEKKNSIFMIISFNLMIFFALIGLLIFVPPISYVFFKPKHSIYDMVKLPNYKGDDKAINIFKELDQLKVKYYDYIVYRREDFNGQTVNIRDGIRQTYVPKVLKKNTEFLFFGGSTMFGMGVRDDDTIPSKFAKIAGVKAINFGETGWIARQQLSILINNYINKGNNVKRYVIFFDGINNIGSNCRVNNDGLSTVRQIQIQNQVKDMKSKFEFKRTFQQFLDFLNVVATRLKEGNNFHKNNYNCNTDIEKAKLVAKNQVETWMIVQKLTEAHGDKFLAILQPTAHIGNANTSHLKLENNSIYQARGDQLKTVYPLIKEQAIKRGINFVDFTRIYDGKEFIYTDTAHASPNGHDRIAKELKKIIFND